MPQPKSLYPRFPKVKRINSAVKRRVMTGFLRSFVFLTAIIRRFARDVKPNLQSGTKPDGLAVVRLRTKKKRGVKNEK